ncbi:amidohydrolase family protein [Amycolatopsis nigrescens]|uniref:amidohydrolase family protein n=1 Tax=Amycolatopsis nigrescens TaxID=381445 RepID=UPI00036D8D5E|nr:amidohydrolase family protein [Amycolatopsis nigrescens]
MTGPVIDAHVRIGSGREVTLHPATLVSTMDELGIDHALVAPDERCVAFANTEGNNATAAAARASGGRLLAYAVANPWQGRAAVAELERAAGLGAVALAVDPVLQGFDLLDGLVDPLLEFARERSWPVYVRTGTPPTALPLPLASLARRYPELNILMGRSGATDFWIDAAPALRYAPNLYADTSYAPWDTVLSEFAADPEIGTARVVFSTDSPYTVPKAEIGRVRDWTISDAERAKVLGGTVAGLLGLAARVS